MKSLSFKYIIKLSSKEVVVWLKDNRNYEKENIDQMNEEELDSFIVSLGEFLTEIKAQTNGIYIQNTEKVLQIQFCHAVLKKIARGNGLVVKSEFHKPVESMGSVTVEGSTISFEDMKWLCRAAEFADSTEIYPLANGKTRMTFTFHGLIKRID